jgi:hypothetical protein
MDGTRCRMTGIVVALSVASLLAASPAGAAQTFEATLDGGSQVPKVDSKATGSATFTLSEDGKAIAYTVSVHDLRDVTMAHIHIGVSGKNGPVVVWLYPAAGKPKLIKGITNGELATGEITAANLTGPEKGKPLSDLVQDMKSGDAYVNVHTAEHKAGEIRGEIK